MHDVLAELNEEQKQAATSLTGPTIILAGPGTGKTKTLVSRLVYLLSEGTVDPSRVAALTFTQRAAAEMKQRLHALLGESLPDPGPFIGTFHALSYQLLARGQSAPRLASEVGRRKIIRSILKENFADDTSLPSDVRKLSLQLSLLKSKPSNFTEDESLRRFRMHYDTALAELGLKDFDDILLESLDYTIKEGVALFDYLLIDEFQDTNDVQYQLAKSLIDSSNIFVIGDPYQSIYAWRGAHTASFARFRKDFPEHTEITLLSNYRSAGEVLKISQALFPKTVVLQSKNQLRGSVKLISTWNEYTESEWVTDELQRLMGALDLHHGQAAPPTSEQNVRFSDIAILYRIHMVGRILERELIKRNIPYQVVGEVSVYEQPAVATLITCLKLINLYRSGGNASEIDLLWQDLADNEYIEEVLADLRLLLPSLASTDHQLAELTKEILITFDWPNLLGRQQQNFLEQFLNMLWRFDGKEGLTHLINYLTDLESRDYYDEHSDKVTLLTMHAAKGLEFEHVVICGFEEGLIPYLKSSKDNEDIEEEKRLLYVALTRAKRNLYLTYPRWRFKKPTQISRFYSLINHAPLQTIEDPAIERIRQHRAKLQQQRSQLKLL